MSSNVTPIRPPLNLRALDGRYRCIVRYRGHVVTAVLDPEKLSPSGNFVYFGGFHSDELRGWYAVDDIEVVEVLAKIETVHQEKPQRWWKRLLGLSRHG